MACVAAEIQNMHGNGQFLIFTIERIPDTDEYKCVVTGTESQLASQLWSLATWQSPLSRDNSGAALTTRSSLIGQRSQPRLSCFSFPFNIVVFLFWTRVKRHGTHLSSEKEMAHFTPYSYLFCGFFFFLSDASPDLSRVSKLTSKKQGLQKAGLKRGCDF